MDISGSSYLSYLHASNLLAPLGVGSAGNFVMDVFSAAVNNLQNKINSQIFSEESTNALSSLYGEISGLVPEASKLTLDDINSVFNDRTPVSSDTDVLTATAFNALSSQTGAAEATYDISVAQLAQVQENTGVELNATDASVVDQGTNTFTVSINGEDFELAVAVEEGDTNEDVLQKIALAINEESGLEVTAEVIDGSEEGSRQLVVQADNTGAANEFTIADVSGNAVAATGADTVSAAAQDASYTVGGEAHTADSNTVSLDEGMVTVSLKGVGDATLTVAPDESEVTSAITSFVSGLNSFMEFLGENEEYITDEVLASVVSYISDHENELESFGITVKEDGTLAIDQTQLSEAVGEDLAGIKETFAGIDGLAVRVDNQLSDIALDSPLNYVKEAEDMNADFTEYIYSSSADMITKLLQGMVLDTYI